MLFHKVTQEEIDKAKNNGNNKLWERLTSKWVKQHKSSKLNSFFNWLSKNSVLINMFLSFF